MALAPQWIDEIIEGCRDVDSVLAAFTKSTKLREAIAQGIKEAEENQARDEISPVCGPGYEQTVRCAIVDVVSSDS